MTVRLKPVEEQVVVLTGASSGIGLATARLFAERGARLVLVARNAEALRKIADELNGPNRGQPPRAVVAPADTSNRQDLERVVQTAINTFGGFDTWVNDAAAALYGPVVDIPIEDQRRQFEVNYWGYVYGSLLAAQHLRRRGGAIINVGSVLSDRSMVYQTQYSATKHAVKAFTDGLRMELERDGAPISVTLIKPSSIHTPYVEHARNYLDSPGVTVPPPTYDPYLVAKAIVFAAEHPRRELTVGFGGRMISAMGGLFPRLTDFAMELTGYTSQTTSRPPPAARRDNLFRAKQDGAEHSTQPASPRKTSLLLTAQMHPAATAAAVVAGLGLVAAAFFGLRGRQGGRHWDRTRQRLATMPARTPEVVTKRSGNGHGQETLGPGHFAQRETGRRPAQPRH